MSRRRMIAAIVAVVVVAAVALGIVMQSRGPIPEIQTGVADRGELAVTVTISGATETGVKADVYPPTAGTLAEVLVEEGEEVAAGDPIAIMDTEPIEAQVQMAEVGYLGAIAQRDAITAQVPTQDDIDAAYAAADMAEAAYLQAVAATKELDGAVAGLLALGVSTSEDLGSITTTDPALASALGALSGALTDLDGMTLTQLGTQVSGLQSAEAQAMVAYQQAEAQAQALEEIDMDSSLASARAAVNQAASALRLAEEMLTEATMTAPISGVVVFNGAPEIAGLGSAGGEPGPGYAVTPASAPFTVVRLGALQFKGDVDEADVDSIEEGMPATVVLDAFLDDEFVTEVSRVGVVSQLTATGGNAFPLYAELNETGRDILVGMRGSADIEVSRITGAVSVPIEAIFEEGGTAFVYELVGETIQRRDVEVGIYTETDVEVVSGLGGDEEVALTSSIEFEDGMRVRVNNDPARMGIFGGFQ